LVHGAGKSGSRADLSQLKHAALLAPFGCWGDNARVRNTRRPCPL